MDNQHKHIKGYRDLDEREVAAMNALKDMEAACGRILADLDEGAMGDQAAGRWTSIARTHLETGFMYAIKAVARPTNGLGRKDTDNG